MLNCFKNKNTNDKNDSFFKRHKKEILVGATIAVGVAVFGVVYSFDKNKEMLMDTINPILDKSETLNNKCLEIDNICKDNLLNQTLEVDIIPRAAHFVSAHMRKLPEGQHASVEKLLTAQDYGYDISDGTMTWVRDYYTRDIA